MTQLQQINQQLQRNELEEALHGATALVESNPGDAAALFLRGKIRWRMGDRAGATTDYAAAAAIDPASPAAKALEHARDVANFFNPDIFNP